jgi:hypothetical protein
MNAGLWTAPALLAGPSAILWGATRLERLVAPPAYTDVSIPDAASTEPDVVEPGIAPA